MRILITGGAGFIGSHLAEALLEQGHHVTIWDNLHTGSEKNLSHLPTENLDFFKYDIRDAHDFQGDAVLNLACPASPVHYQHDPIYTWETSVLGVRNMLRLAEAQGAIFMHASTSEVYGDPEQHPQNEDYWGNVNPVGIRSCYDEGKRAAETLAIDYQRTRDLDVRLFRIFNTYGPRMMADDGRVVSNFCVQAIEGNALTIYGDGSQTRSFCYVSDLVAGIIALLNLKKGQVTRPVNLGNDGEFTIKQLAEVVAEKMGSNLEIVYKDLPADDPKQRRPDLSQARKLIGWQPEIALAEGIGKTLAYFKKHLA